MVGVEDIDDGFINDNPSIEPLNIFIFGGDLIVKIKTLQYFVTMRREIIDKFSKQSLFYYSLLNNCIDVKVSLKL